MKVVLNYKNPARRLNDLLAGDCYALCTHFNDVLLQHMAKPTIFMKCYDGKTGGEYFSVELFSGHKTIHHPDKLVRQIFGELRLSVTDHPEELENDSED